MPNSGRDTTFLGMTKLQFLIIAVCIFSLTTLGSLGALAVNVRASNARAVASQEEVDIARKLVADIKGAVCGMKDNSRKQIRQTTTFLIDHPGPEPIPGVPRQTLVDGLQRQRDFLDTMQSLDCD